ncbi:MAG: Rrf2 family transcriptional regulator [Bacteroidia bacterium]|nr:Rrf2 family transcriptional regulator [Bacteroidia bacterium]NND52151.1 Rrf2 family transcriptional regulator [Flavobacteriaceae bacterium]
MFSNASKYAIKAAIFLALHTDNNCKITVKEIAESINVPQAYIAKLLQELSRKNVISSAKGPKGGFFVSEANKKIPLIQIITALNAGERMDECLLSLDKCDTEKPCPLHKFAYPLRSQLIANLSKKTIGEISDEVTKGKAFLPL